MVSTPEGRLHTHDPELLDRLADFTATRFEGEVWRATRVNQDPTAFSYNGGRWAPPSSYQSVPVLYTSLNREGAVAEMASWLNLLDPLPTKPILIHRLAVAAPVVVTMTMTDLVSLDVRADTYAERNYVAMGEAPPSRSQEIGAALSFLGIDGLIAPSARASAQNLILFDNGANQIDLDVLDVAQTDWRI